MGAYLVWTYLPSTCSAVNRVGAIFIVTTAIAAVLGYLWGNPYSSPFQGTCQTVNEVVVHPDPDGISINQSSFTDTFFEKHNMVKPDIPILVLQGVDVAQMHEIVPVVELQRQRDFYAGVPNPPSTNQLLILHYGTVDSKPSVVLTTFAEVLSYYSA